MSAHNQISELSEAVGPTGIGTSQGKCFAWVSGVPTAGTAGFAVRRRRPERVDPQWCLSTSLYLGDRRHIGRADGQADADGGTAPRPNHVHAAKAARCKEARIATEREETLEGTWPWTHAREPAWEEAIWAHFSLD